jgi:hypothetical protein
MHSVFTVLASDQFLLAITALFTVSCVIAFFVLYIRTSKPHEVRHIPGPMGPPGPSVRHVGLTDRVSISEETGLTIDAQAQWQTRPSATAVTPRAFRLFVTFRGTGLPIRVEELEVRIDGAASIVPSNFQPIDVRNGDHQIYHCEIPARGLKAISNRGQLLVTTYRQHRASFEIQRPFD